jgi:hypothetical protein
MPHLIRIGNHTDISFDDIRCISFRMAPAGQAPLAAVVDIMHHTSFVSGGIDALMLMQYIHNVVEDRFFVSERRESFPVTDPARPDRVEAVVLKYHNLGNVSSAHYRVDDRGTVQEAVLGWPDGHRAEFQAEASHRLRDALGRLVESKLIPAHATREHYHATYGGLFPTFAPATARKAPGSEPHIVDYGEPTAEDAGKPSDVVPDASRGGE